MPHPDEQGWAVDPDDDWRLSEDGSILAFSFGARCPCWVELSLTETEQHSCAGPDKKAIEALIRSVHAAEHQYRTRLKPA